MNELTDGGFTKVLNNSTASVQIPKPSITLKELMDLNDAAKRVLIPPDVMETITKIRMELRNDDIWPSTRRFVKALKLIQVNALLDGATISANITHVNILKDILWDKEEQIKTVAATVQKYCVDNFTQQLQEFIQMAQEIYDFAMKDGSTEAGPEANKKMKAISNDLIKLKNDNPAKTSAIEVTESKVRELNKEVLAKCLGI